MLRKLVSLLKSLNNMLFFSLAARGVASWAAVLLNAFEGKGLKDWGNQVGFRSADQEV